MKLTFPMALGLLFIGLRLADVVHWSWLWVLFPFWGPLALVVIFYGVYAVMLFFEDENDRNIREAREALDKIAARLKR